MFESEIRVRFCETDMLGHINNTSYFAYLEDARTLFFDEFGELDENCGFILASVTCDFIAQAYFKQPLTVQTFITKIGTKSFHMGHNIVDSNTKAVIARGKAVIVYFNFEEQRSVELSQESRHFLQGALTGAIL